MECKPFILLSVLSLVFSSVLIRSQVVNSFDQEQRRALLRFVTSCSWPPLLYVLCYVFRVLSSSHLLSFFFLFGSEFKELMNSQTSCIIFNRCRHRFYRSGVRNCCSWRSSHSFRRWTKNRTCPQTTGNY